MHFIIWGAGFRGQRCFEVLGSERIIAFIDSNMKLVGKQICGKDVISYQEYKTKYPDTFIIISMLDYMETESFLIADKNFLYFILAKQPQECLGWGENIIKEFPLFYNPKLPTVIKGVNIITVELCENLVRAGCTRFVVRMGSEKDSDKIRILKKYFEKYWSETIEIEDVEYNFFLADNSVSIYNINNFSLQIPGYYNSKIADLHNKYNGKRCFICCTGPSLKIEDLTILHEHHDYCISMNKIFCAFENTKWRPNLYLATDLYVIMQNIENIKELDVDNIFLSDSFKGAPEIPRFHQILGDQNDFEAKFSEDVSRYCYSTASVTYACLQFAVYLGFKEIYLLGCDFNYGYMGKQGNHFYKAEDKVNNKPRYDISLKEYQFAKNYADSHGIKIFNATRGGKLEVFERVDFDKLF